MEKLELLQRIGESVCEGCGPNADCGIEPPKCQRINSAAIALDKYVNIENQQEGNKSAFSEGLGGLLIRMLDLSDQFESFCCAESDDFTRGQFDGKSLAYSDCANFLREIIEEAA